MVLAFKKDQKTPLVEVNSKLIKKLKPHQVEGKSPKISFYKIDK